MSTSWPLGSKYQEALQNHSRCLRDSELCQGRVDTDTTTKIPLVFSGGYAAVFRLTCRERKFALKCFLYDIPNRMVRYSEISQFILNDSESTWATFSFMEQGIMVGGVWYPILKMEWVDGLELNRYIAQQLHGSHKLQNLARQFRRLAQGFNQKGIAHGDLQHGNIIVYDDLIKLIDYDDMYLPSLKKEEGSGLGHPNYAHPMRQKKDYGPEIDNFSSIVIYLSILALSEDKSLWSKYYTEENLILNKNDFRDPENSPCLKELRNSQDEVVSNLATKLTKYCHIKPNRIPSLDDVLDDRTVVILSPKDVLPPPPLVFSENKIISPKASEVWEPGIGHYIVWQTSEDYGEIKVYLHHDTREPQLITRGPSALRSLLWNIPKFESGGNSYRIVIRSSKTDEVIEVSDPFTILLPAWNRSFELFKKYDCSWCKKFYSTQPWLCNYGKITLDQDISSGRNPQCRLLSRMSGSERNKAMADERWWWRIYDEISSAFNSLL